MDSEALHQLLPQAQIRRVGFEVGNTGVDELSAEELVGCQSAQQLQLLRAEFYSDACHIWIDSSLKSLHEARSPGLFPLDGWLAANAL